ncbi:MAG: metallophosphoesterase [Candidatus Omnitrophota bacterium]
MTFNSDLLKIAFITANTILLILLFVFYGLWNNKKLALPAAFLLVILLGSYLQAKYIEPNWIEINKVTLEKSALPDGAQNLVIVHITDPHIWHFGFRENVLIKKINKLKPDIIIMTGDYMLRPDIYPLIAHTVSKFKAKTGIYAILGDNDYYRFKGPLEKIGVKFIDDKKVRIRAGSEGGIWLIGGNIDKVDMRLYDGLPANEPKILLLHSAENIGKYPVNTGNTDLILSGDTHGEQMGLPFLRKYTSLEGRFKYISGLYKVNDGVLLYVNKGVGTRFAGEPRIFCRPEIAVIKLKTIQ